MARTPDVTVGVDVQVGEGFDHLAAMSTAQVQAAYIDGLLQAAVDRAQVFIRAGRYGRGEYELVRAELRVARITGDVEAVERLEQIRYFEFGGRAARGGASW